ncbi:hypothetical protein, partial [Xylella fastidiosa]|uniref:hypothetical protein n=1 Tax=Xylella fastidiosa TaxID=2371 RepID=UPI001EECF34A
RFMVAMHAAIAPVGEARDDYTILSQLAERLDIAPAYTEGRDAREWLRHLYEVSRPRSCGRCRCGRSPRRHRRKAAPARRPR